MKFYVESYGCTMNQGETEMLAKDYTLKGHERVNTLDEADMVMIGTFVVITKTENRMKRRIKELSKTCSNIVVTGCLTTIDDHIDSLCSSAKVVPPSEIPMTLEGDYNTRMAVIPISSGCIGRCAYCITKLARGDLRSRPIDEIVEKFRNMIKSDVKEIRLSSQDNASYGIDMDVNLTDLLHILTEFHGDHRIRIGMMNPDTAETVLEELKIILQSPNIYKFLHLPLQSGSDDILRRMNRKYTVQDWLSLVDELCNAFPELTLSTDVIVGFPGESDEEFERTKNILEKVKPDIVNITRFSPRPGTAAATMDSKVHSSIKKERSKELTSQHMDTSRKINEKYVGREMNVLLLEKGKDGSITGRTDNYKVVVIKTSDESLLGKRVNVVIKEASDVYLLGELI